MKKEFWPIIILSTIIVLAASVFFWTDSKDNFWNLSLKNVSVKQNQEIESPLEVSGEARGTWFFEASFPIKITDDQGNILGSSYVQALSDWMTEDFVAFKGTINFSLEEDQRGFLVLSKDNPSGLAEYDEEVKIPVMLKKTEYITVQVFFGNSNLDPEISCDKVFPVYRKIKKTEAVGAAAINELLKGPTDEERMQGYFSSIPEGSVLNSIKIENGTAFVDFNETTESGGGSCSMTERISQINFTLKQFPTVKNVIISINGRTDDIFQP